MTDSQGAPEKKKSWFARHKILTGIGALILLGIIIGAASPKDGNTTVTNTPANASASPSASAAPAKQTAKVGDTIMIGGSKGLSVTLSQIIDPAQGSDQYTTPDAGKRFVGVKLVITNDGTGSFKDDANGDVTLVGSDNQSYTADFNGIAGCTNFSEGGDFTLAPGASTTGCVNFQVPNGVTTAKVQFAPNEGFSGDTGEWTAQ